MRKLAIATALLTLVVAPALAQAPPQGTPTRIRGFVDKLDGNKLTVKTREGPVVTIALADNFTVAALEKKAVADIKQNDYVMTTGLKDDQGKLHCTELRIAPEALRGAAEGQFPWDSQPDAVMTNATVSGLATAKFGQDVKVKYKDSEIEFVAENGQCQVFGYVQADASLLKHGAAVFVVAAKKDDGSLSAARVTAEKDGVKPPK